MSPSLPRMVCFLSLSLSLCPVESPGPEQNREEKTGSRLFRLVWSRFAISALSYVGRDTEDGGSSEIVGLDPWFGTGTSTSIDFWLMI